MSLISQQRPLEWTMSIIHLHLILNHIPIIWLGFTLVLLLICLGLNSHLIKQISMGFFLLVAIVTVPTYLTGQISEEVAKETLTYIHNLAHFVEHHEEAATFTFIASSILGFLSLSWLILDKRFPQAAKWLMPVILLAALVTGALYFATANIGGQIRRPDIRQDPISQFILSRFNNDHQDNHRDNHQDNHHIRR
jgi:hypothetical protein